ncbi:amidohydrolase [Paenibacillus sp. WLX2291]|uniref:amidohydrolase n=1 Tax=Paenibacillus sp. WLX2291 TaxID=3296934 RepID=UPI0039846141
MRIWIRNAIIITMEDGDTPFNGDITIEGDRITGLYREEDVHQHQLSSQQFDRMIDANHMIAMPGLINAHQHSPMNLLKAFSDDLKLMDWLEQKMFPAEARMTAEDIYWGSKMSMAEMIRSGTTTFADMYIHMNDIATAVEETGMRASLTRGLVFIDDQAQQRLVEAVDLVEKWHHAADGRITTMFGPHSPYLCPPEQLRHVIELAEQYKRPIHIHLGETKEEVAIMRERYNQTPTQYLHELGLFENAHILLAHGVHLNTEDIHALTGMRGGVSHNPVSNLKLGCGIAPVTELQRNGITVGLGTDGAGSATTLDMFAGIKTATWLQKLHYGDPTVLPAYKAVQMATLDSARLLNIDHETGSLQVGKKADVILIDLDKPHVQPVHEPVSLLAYAVQGSDVHTTIVNGQILMDNRELVTMDEQLVLAEGKQRAKRIVEGV